jgi:hypothetical protein
MGTLQVQVTESVGVRDCVGAGPGSFFAHKQHAPAGYVQVLRMFPRGVQPGVQHGVRLSGSQVQGAVCTATPPVTVLHNSMEQSRQKPSCLPQ